MFRFIKIISCIILIYPFFSISYIRKWELPKSHWDARLLKNQASYLVEGTGGGKVLLYATFKDIFQIWGNPTHRTYHKIETLHYQHSLFHGKFILERGVLKEIVFLVNDASIESLKWYTALGLRQNDFINQNTNLILQKIKKFYKKAHTVILNNEIIVYGRGIRFKLSKNKIVEIGIFPVSSRLENFH